eukprot:5009467-Amphidinium_carterae.1
MQFAYVEAPMPTSAPWQIMRSQDALKYNWGFRFFEVPGDIPTYADDRKCLAMLLGTTVRLTEAGRPLPHEWES